MTDTTTDPVFDTSTAAGRLRILWGATADPQLAMSDDEVADVATVLDEHAEMAAELERLRRDDEQNVGSDRLPMTKRELKALGYELAKPINLDRSQLSWDRAEVKKLYWALQQARGVAMIAEKKAERLESELGRMRAQAAELAVAEPTGCLSQGVEDEAEFLRAAIEDNPYPAAEEYARACYDRDRIGAELARVRAEFAEQLADAKEVALDKLVVAFGEGWDNCRMRLDDEARLKRGVAVTQYSNQLPWPTYVAPPSAAAGDAGVPA